MDSAYFSGVVEGKKCFSEIFFCFQNLDAIYRPVGCSGQTVGARGFVFGGGHFCGICPKC